VDLNDLINRRAQNWDAMTKLLDDASAAKREMTGEETQTYERLEGEVEADTKQIDLRQRHEARGRGFDKVETDPIVNPGNSERDADDPAGDKAYGTAFRSYLRGGVQNLDPEQRSALAKGFNSDPEIRAQSVGTTTAGGYLVPPGFRDEFIKTMKDYGSVQRVAQVITTDTGAPLQWPTMNDTAQVGALLAENTQFAEQDVAVGTATLDAYVYYSKLTRASLQLVQDSAFDVESTVRDAHAERVGRITNQHFTTGTGTNQPDGIVTGAASGVTAAGVAAITADELIDLVHSVDPAYRRSPRARWMLSDTALKSIRKLKSNDNQYLWQPGLQDGVGSNLLGYPYEINVDMAVPATGVKSVLFGDFFAGYVIRIVRGIQTITFSERYLDYLQVAWASYARMDGTTQNTSAYKALTQA
jgi:HK97 family phage major capsid protein